MNEKTKQLLSTWLALENGDGLQRAASRVRILSIVHFVLFVLIVVSVGLKLNPAAIAAGAAILGWVTAERNALRTRASQWPIFKRYIDWKLVQADLNKEQDTV